MNFIIKAIFIIFLLNPILALSHNEEKHEDPIDESCWGFLNKAKWHDEYNKYFSEIKSSWFSYKGQMAS